VGLGAAGSDIGTAESNSPRDAQFLTNFLQRGVLGKPLKGVRYGLFVRDTKSTPLPCRRQADAEGVMRSSPLTRLLLGETVHRAAAQHEIHGVQADHGSVFE